MRWREEPEFGPLRTAWEGLRDALAELRAALGRAWGHRRTEPAAGEGPKPRGEAPKRRGATAPLLADPRLRAPWSADVLAPPAGSVCSRCGSAQWWSERRLDGCKGWRCMRCYPAPVEAGDVVRVNTRTAAGR